LLSVLLVQEQFLKGSIYPEIFGCYLINRFIKYANTSTDQRQMAVRPELSKICIDNHKGIFHVAM
jgi:hypothetical protein